MSPPGLRRVGLAELGRFCRAALTAAGGDERTAEAATRAMLHASELGVDSHGVRLLPHYAKAIAGGRVNGAPKMRFTSEFGSAATLAADNAHGAVAAYAAMGKATAIARRLGLGAVAIRDSSHFGAAGAYALAAAERGLVGVATCNSDSIVRLHEGAERFHGTNPLAVAAPMAGARPWLLDMASSAIPYNRVLLFRSLGQPLPPETASDLDGRDTVDAEEAEMLAPLGGAQGYKGAGLAGLAEILSAALTGMAFSYDLASMDGPDFSTPRHLGAFVMAIDPLAFGAENFAARMKGYAERLRSSREAEGGEPMAPGDREWRQADRRRSNGVPIDPDSWSAFQELARRYGLTSLGD